jgi:tRNA(fMet)-specific endonuclease VapC
MRNASLSQQIEQNLKPFSRENDAIISVVSIGELYSIALRNKWGAKKLDLLNLFLQQFIIADINIEEIIENYAYLDAYSQGKIENESTGYTARNMGKNDLWIAATCLYIDAILLTTDKDFSHLKNKLNIQEFEE